MMGRDQLRLLSAAHAVALNARCGQLALAQVTALDQLARGLDPDDQLRSMVDGFCARQRVVFRDPSALSEAGDELLRNVLRQLRPTPIDVRRMDVHG